MKTSKMKKVKFRELSEEQKIDALERVIYMNPLWIDKHDTNTLFQEIEGGYDIDNDFNFEIEGKDSFVSVSEK